MQEGTTGVLIFPGLWDWYEITTDPNDLAKLQEIVGGYIEGVPTLGAPLTVFVNEDGIARGYKPSAIHASLGVLLGPVLVFGPPDADGNVTPLDEDGLLQAKALLRPLGR